MLGVTLLVIVAIVLLGVIFVRTVSNIIDNVQEIQAQPKASCRVHRWSYNTNDELQCMVCNKTSLQIEEEHGLTEYNE